MRGHESVVDELVEWFEDVAGDTYREGVGSHCVLVAVPPRWGRTTLLSQLAERVDSHPDISAISCRLAGSEAPDGLALQTGWLAQVLTDVLNPSRVRRVLGIDSAHGVFDRALGAGDAVGLLGGRAASIAAFLVTVGVDAWVGWDSRENAGQLAEVDRLGRRVARFSKEVAVTLLIDNCEQLDPRLVDRLITAVVSTVGSRVLVVVVVSPSHPIAEILHRQDRVGGAAGRVQRLELDASMDDDQRHGLVRSLAPDWPRAAVDRLAQRAAALPMCSRC